MSSIISFNYLSHFLSTDWAIALFLNHWHTLVTNASVATWNTNSVDLVDHADNAIFGWHWFLHLTHFNTDVLIKVRTDVKLFVRARSKHLPLEVRLNLCIILSLRLNLSSIWSWSVLTWWMDNNWLSLALRFYQTWAGQLIINMTYLYILEIFSLPLCTTYSKVENTILYFTRMPIISTRLGICESNIVLSIPGSIWAWCLKPDSIRFIRHLAFCKHSSFNNFVIMSLMFIPSVWKESHIFWCG